MQRVQRREEALILENNRKLEDATRVGYAIEDNANDIKINLNAQEDKMQNSILSNLHGIQGSMTLSNRLITAIKKEHMKNKALLYGVVIFLLVAIIFILYRAFF